MVEDYNSLYGEGQQIIFKVHIWPYHLCLVRIPAFQAGKPGPTPGRATIDQKYSKSGAGH